MLQGGRLNDTLAVARRRQDVQAGAAQEGAIGALLMLLMLLMLLVLLVLMLRRVP